MVAGPHLAYNSPANIVELTGSDQQITIADSIFLGYVVADDAAGQVTLNFHHGTDNSGTLICTARPANNAETTFWFGPNGIHCPGGIYADADSGTPSGSVFIRT